MQYFRLLFLQCHHCLFDVSIILNFSLLFPFKFCWWVNKHAHIHCTNVFYLYKLLSCKQPLKMFPIMMKKYPKFLELLLKSSLFWTCLNEDDIYKRLSRCTTARGLVLGSPYLVPLKYNNVIMGMNSTQNKSHEAINIIIMAVNKHFNSLKVPILLSHITHLMALCVLTAVILNILFLLRKSSQGMPS